MGVVVEILIALLLAAPQSAAPPASLAGQPATPRFETVTIRRNVSRETTGGGAYITNGRLRMTNVTANALMRPAYWAGTDLAPSQIVDGPDWVDSEGFDVTATVGPEFAGKNTNQMMPFRRALLRSLLEDRFRLKMHRETRELQRYALTMAHADGTYGPQLRRPSPQCSPAVAACTVRVAPGHFSMGYGPLPALVNYLARSVVRTAIVDRTGLQGMFALDLEWPTDQPLAISTALQQQLGLKLEPERGPVDVVVIDHIEQPVED